MQIDNLSELGKEKMPPERIIWDGTSDDIEDWIDRVMDRKKSNQTSFVISENDIES